MSFINVVLDDGAFEPVRGHREDAGLDLRAPVDVAVPAGGSAVIDLGVHIEIPYGYYGKLESKSGLNVKHSVVSHGGVIDCGYTGSIIAKLYNHGTEDYTFKRGDKVIQLIVVPCELPTVKIVDELPNSERGTGAMGSTGK